MAPDFPEQPSPRRRAGRQRTNKVENPPRPTQTAPDKNANRHEDTKDTKKIYAREARNQQFLVSLCLGVLVVGLIVTLVSRVPVVQGIVFIDFFVPRAASRPRVGGTGPGPKKQRQGVGGPCRQVSPRLE